MKIEGLDEKYTNSDLYIVAFFDVLGVKNKLKKDFSGTLGDLWMINHHLVKEKAKNDNLIVRTFSDNFLIALKTSEERLAEDFSTVGNIVGFLYNLCLRMYNILLRGAIAVGDMHIDENIVLGEALIKAYKMESEIAIYPRIVIDQDIIKIKSSNKTSFSFTNGLFQDTDLQWCLNVLKFCNELMEKSCKSTLVSNITAQFMDAKNSKDARVASKINWLINYVNTYYYQNYNEILIDFDKE